MPATSAPTLKDIARATGVSMMTVSRVQRRAPKVAHFVTTRDSFQELLRRVMIAATRKTP